jgi:shikimate dehydrogenase
MPNHTQSVTQSHTVQSTVEQYKVYGNPISQSKSPFIHTLFARQTNQNISYTASEPDVGQFISEVSQFFAQGGRGCNITMPFKEEAFQFADRLTERAKLAGAVNTLKKLDDGQVLGDTTDGEGLVQDLLQYNTVLNGAKVLLIGSGGAARGVIQPLLEQNPQSLTITNRTFDKAQQLQQVFAHMGPIVATPLEQVNDGFDVVINSTSTSLSNSLPPVEASIFNKRTVAYDMVYGKGITTFNQWALDNGAAHAYDGLGMLVGQAAESFMLWRGIRPGAKQVLRELRKNLQA